MDKSNPYESYLKELFKLIDIINRGSNKAISCQKNLYELILSTYKNIIFQRHEIIKKFIDAKDLNNIYKSIVQEFIEPLLIDSRMDEVLKSLFDLYCDHGISDFCRSLLKKDAVDK